jgi:hypothetical protein
MNQHEQPSSSDHLIKECRSLEKDVKQIEQRNAKQAERWRSLHLAGGVFVGLMALAVGLREWRHPSQSTGILTIAAVVVAYLALSLQPNDREAIHSRAREQALSLLRDLRRFRELTVFEPESFTGAHERELALLSQSVDDIRGAEREVP